MRKRRHHTRETKNGQNFARLPLLLSQKRRKKKRKKEQNYSSFLCATKHTHARERERESKQFIREREKKRMRENIIVANKDNTKRMTTRERQHIEVAKLEAELNALKVDAFAKVRLMRLFF